MPVNSSTQAGRNIITATLADGEAATFNFGKRNDWVEGVPWVAIPLSGATITITAQIDSTYFAHASNPSVSGTTADVENTPLANLRFSTAGGGATIELSSKGVVKATIA